MNSFSGTWRLIRLVLRVDRIKLPLWLLLTVGIIAVSIPQLTHAYGSGAQRQAYVAATAPSVVTRLWNGALTGPSIGEISVVETAFIAFLMIALLNIFLVIRHTRKNEELGRAELLGASVVGRQATLTAVLLIAFVANLLCALLLYIIATSNGLPSSGAVLYGVGVGASGMFFAVMAAVMAQLFQSARAANSASVGVFGIALLIRGTGDATGSLAAGGLGVQTNWFSYLSPLGWVTGSRPYGQEQPAWLLLFIPLILCGLVAAYTLLVKRDMGAGIFAPRLGRAHAKPALLRRFGLQWRINRTSFISWLIGMILVGATLGGVAKEFESLLAGNEEMQKMLTAFGGGGSVSDIMFSATFVIMAIATAAYIIQLLVRMHTEETSGRLGLTLSTNQSRTNWIITNTAFAFMTGTAILIATGAVTGATYGMVTGGVAHNTVKLTAAILVQLPAVLVLASVSTLLFSVLPKLFVPAAWSLLAASLLDFQLGALLNLPQWLINISPFTHTPAAPAANLSVLPLVLLSTIFVGTYAASIVLMSRRDLING